MYTKDFLIYNILCISSSTKITELLEALTLKTPTIVNHDKNNLFLNELLQFLKSFLRIY